MEMGTFVVKISSTSSRVAQFGVLVCQAALHATVISAVHETQVGQPERWAKAT